jgi:hypothetical protein
MQQELESERDLVGVDHPRSWLAMEWHLHQVVAFDSAFHGNNTCEHHY